MAGQIGTSSLHTAPVVQTNPLPHLLSLFQWLTSRRTKRTSIPPTKRGVSPTVSPKRRYRASDLTNQQVCNKGLITLSGTGTGLLKRKWCGKWQMRGWEPRGCVAFPRRWDRYLMQKDRHGGISGLAFRGHGIAAKQFSDVTWKFDFSIERFRRVDISIEKDSSQGNHRRRRIAAPAVCG